MTNHKGSPVWRTDVQHLPHAQYSLDAKKPQDFDRVAFLTFVKPSSDRRREITNEWLLVGIPALNNSTLEELQETGSRLTKKWTSKERDRLTFWTNVTAAEEVEKRDAHLNSAGGKRLQAAESYLVVDSQHHFVMQTALLKDRLYQNQQKDWDRRNQQEDKDQPNRQAFR